MSRGLPVLLVALAVLSCRASSTPSPVPVPLPQAAYVWQRNWTPGVRAAVAQPPVGIESFRVLIAEVSPSDNATDETAPMTSAVAMMNVDAAALATAGVPITIVVRVEGSRPLEGLELSPFVRVGDSLRAAGVDVVGIEVDHDCATGRLADYARWLERQREVLAPSSDDTAIRQHAAASAPYRFSITALPTWASSPSLLDVARTVDEIVVQVHAVRAPLIFEANSAWRHLVRFSRALHPTTSVTVASSRSPVLRVALPTYAAVVRDVEVRVDPDDVSRFASKLSMTRDQDPDLARVSGIVWFRLPVEGDEQTWSRATFARVVDGVMRTNGAHDSMNADRATIELVARGDQRFDVVVSNPTDEVVDLPRVRIAGDVTAADMVMGYRAAGPGTWDAPRRSIPRNERIVIGWIHGKDVSLVD